MNQRITRFFCLFLLGVFLLTSCDKNVTRNLPTLPTADEFSSNPSELLPPTLSPTEQPLVLSTSELAQVPSLEPPDNDILEFSFPTPNSEAVSLWRPPLYEVPWALNPFDHFYFTRPVAADEINWPLANYRYGGIFFGTDIVHTGIDIPAPLGTTVIAAGPGKVVWAGYGLFYGNSDPNDPYGLAVSIKHDFGYQERELYTIYAHMNRVDVVLGQQVETGTPLGIIGMTGKTTGPHLHFEVRIEDNSFYSTRNPELWIAPPQGWGVLAGDFRNTNGSFLTEQVVKIRSLNTNQKWEVITYGSVTVHKDEYYQENLVIGDLPAGDYEISLDYLDQKFDCQTIIFPGAITFINFNGEHGFNFEPPPTPEPETWLESGN